MQVPELMLGWDEGRGDLVGVAINLITIKIFPEVLKIICFRGMFLKPCFRLS